MLQIAILGFGVVGSGTAEVLEENKKLIAKRCGEEIHVKYILDLRDFPAHPMGDRVVHDVNIIINDPEVTLVAEMMGGSHPAYEFTCAALKAKKSVVTSNKEVVSRYGIELLELARANGVSYFFEASVGGGIPIIRPMQTDLASNEFLAVSGILNGTTNFILTKMKQEGTAFDEALREAQRLGYAEANPAADVEGLDAARKIAILAALSFGVLLDTDDIYTEGITGITEAHTAVAEALGGSIKLIGHTERIGNRVLAMVAPHFVPATNPISLVDGVFNGILVDTDMLGRALFYGAGAGKRPTASAIVADIIDILSSNAKSRKLPEWRKATAEEIASIGEYTCPHCFLIEGCPMCAAKAKQALGSDRVVMMEGKFVIVSEATTKAAALAALKSCGLEPKLVLPVLE